MPLDAVVNDASLRATLEAEGVAVRSPEPRLHLSVIIIEIGHGEFDAMTRMFNELSKQTKQSPTNYERLARRAMVSGIYGC